VKTEINLYYVGLQGCSALCTDQSFSHLHFCG